MSNPTSTRSCTLARHACRICCSGSQRMRTCVPCMQGLLYWSPANGLVVAADKISLHSKQHAGKALPNVNSVAVSASGKVFFTSSTDVAASSSTLKNAQLTVLMVCAV
jgi:hypothetical protein